jgi:glycosyltransferase involved in cell wall biosynthesis
VVCSTNRKMAEYVEKIAGEGRVRESVVVTHGVDIDFFRPLPRDAELARRYGISKDDRVALFLGTTYDFSGLDALVAEWEILREACPNAKLLVVGGGELDARLHALAVEKGLQEKIIQTGFRPYDEIPRHLSLADCCINPFRLNEITRDIVPIKILQYLACGKAVVATPIPDVVAHFPEKESGISYQSIDNPRAFSALVGQFLADDTLRTSFSTASRGFVEKHFSVTRQIPQIEGLLAELAGQPADEGIQNGE